MDKTEKLKKALKARKKEAEYKLLASLFGEEFGKHSAEHYAKIAIGFAAIAKHLNSLEQKTEANKPLAFPDKVKVSNPEDFKKDQQDVKVLNFPKSFKIENQINLELLRDDFHQIIRAANEIVGTSEARNKEEVEALKNFLEDLTTKQDRELIDALRPLQFLTNTPQSPLSVRLSDGEKFYEAIAGITQSFAAAAGGTFTVTPAKSATGVFGAVTVGTTATLIRPAFSDRISLIATVNSAITVFIGLDNTVTPANGLQLKQDDLTRIDQDGLYTGPIFGIVAAGSADVRFIEI